MLAPPPQSLEVKQTLSPLPINWTVSTGILLPICSSTQLPSSCAPQEKIHSQDLCATLHPPNQLRLQAWARKNPKLQASYYSVRNQEVLNRHKTQSDAQRTPEAQKALRIISGTPTSTSWPQTLPSSSRTSVLAPPPPLTSTSWASHGTTFQRNPDRSKPAI